MIDKGLYKTRVGLKKGSDKEDRRQSYSASQTTSGRSKQRSAPRQSPFKGNESRQQYSAIQTATGAVKGGGSKRPGRKDYSTRFVSGDEGRDSRDAFVRGVQETNPNYNPGGKVQYKKPSLGQFFGGLFSLLPGMGIARGLNNLSQRFLNTDFGRSKNLMDYLDMKKFGGYDEREMARRINLDEAKLLQDRIDAGEFDGIGSLDTNNNIIDNMISNIDKLSDQPNLQELYNRDRNLSGMDNFIAPPGQIGPLSNPNAGIPFAGTVLEDEFRSTPPIGDDSVPLSPNLDFFTTNNLRADAETDNEKLLKQLLNPDLGVDEFINNQNEKQQREQELLEELKMLS